MEKDSPKNSNKKWYSEGYKTCYYTGLIGRAYGFVHWAMENRYKAGPSFDRVLEVGSGNGEHFRFVKHDFTTYHMTDINPIDLGDKPKDPRILLQELDCTKLDRYSNGFFDRVIATCLLVHLKDPDAALSEWRRVVKEGGNITLYLAPEPGILLTAIRRLFIWPKAKKLGIINPEYFAYSEHINHYPRMISLVNEIFKEDEIKRKKFPVSFLHWQLSFFEILHITIKK